MGLFRPKGNSKVLSFFMAMFMLRNYEILTFAAQCNNHSINLINILFNATESSN